MLSSNEELAITINKIQLILAEKRTSLSLMRMGIAVFALPLSVFSVLIVTSKYYDALNVLHFLIPIIAICTALLVLGAYLVIKGIVKNHRFDTMINEIKKTHKDISEFIS